MISSVELPLVVVTDIAETFERPSGGTIHSQTGSPEVAC